MSRLAALALLSLGGCAQSRPAVPEQQVIVIDEAGRPVSGATVEIRMNLDFREAPASITKTTFTAGTDRKGVARFQDLPAWTYYCAAYLEPRASLPQGVDFIETETMPGAPVTLTIQELHVGCLDAPGLRWIAFGAASMGSEFFIHPEFRYPDYVRQVEESLTRVFPDARFLSSLCGSIEHAEVNAEWYGYEPVRLQIPMGPASAFPAPRVVRPQDLQPSAWAEVPIRLMEPGGAPVPRATRDAILRRSFLLRWPYDGGKYHAYRPSRDAAGGWTIAAPCAEYRIKWSDSDWRWPEYMANLELIEDTAEIAPTLPAVLRLVRVHVEGPPGDFSVIPQFEAGFEMPWLPGPDRVVELILQPGTWELWLEYHYSEPYGFERFTRTITVDGADAQDLTWTVTRG